jgi:hypothetical protein
MPILEVLIPCGFWLLFAWANVTVANRKHFEPVWWILAASPVGLLVLYLLPSAKKIGLSKEQIRRRVVVANCTGMVLSGIGLGIAPLVYYLEN